MKIIKVRTSEQEAFHEYFPTFRVVGVLRATSWHPHFAPIASFSPGYSLSGCSPAESSRDLGTCRSSVKSVLLLW